METNFPNLFMVLGPLSPFTNLVPAIETEVDWISDTIKHMVENDIETAEPTKAAVEGWRELCLEVARNSMFANTQSWIFGANIPGKKESIRHYLGGLKSYRKEIQERGHNGLLFNEIVKNNGMK